MKKIRSTLNILRLLRWVHAFLVAGLYVIAWQRTRAQGSRLPEARRTSTPRVHPRVSIIVPVRNEERNITRCLNSLLAQDYPSYEILVVDDGSTDGTNAILEKIAQTHPQSERFRVLHLHELPDGWAGKPHALHEGSLHTSGDFMLFTDADTYHAPETLRLVVSRAEERNLDLLSLGTTQELPSFWERVTMPMAFLGISIQYPLSKINDPRSPLALANGQYLLIRRSVYEGLDGYNRPEMRHTLVDDLDLARLVKGAGFTLEIADGRHLVSVRMYQSLHEVWEGWGKNIYLGNRGGLFLTITQIVGLPVVSILPFFIPLWFWLSPPPDRKSMKDVGEASVLSFLELGPLLAYRLWLDKEMNIPWYFALTHPLAGLLFTAMLAQSTWRIVTRKGVDWRGRRYAPQKSQRARQSV